MVTTHIQHDAEKAMSVNVALCGSIPRAHLTKGLGAAGQLAPALHPDKQTDCKRYGSDNITLLKARPSLQVPQNNENLRPSLPERQMLAHAFEAPSWAVPASGEARLEVRTATRTPVKVWSASHLTNSSLSHPRYIQYSPSATRTDVKGLLTCPPRPSFALDGLRSVMCNSCTKPPADATPCSSITPTAVATLWTVEVHMVPLSMELGCLLPPMEEWLYRTRFAEVL